MIILKILICMVIILNIYPCNSNDIILLVIKWKIIGLKDYMFSVVIENSYYEYNFLCSFNMMLLLLSDTIPIYYINGKFNWYEFCTTLIHMITQLKKMYYQKVSNELYNNI